MTDRLRARSGGYGLATPESHVRLIKKKIIIERFYAMKRRRVRTVDVAIEWGQKWMDNVDGEGTLYRPRRDFNQNDDKELGTWEAAFRSSTSNIRASGRVGPAQAAAEYEPGCKAKPLARLGIEW
jgi:hypothetical protein